MKNWYLIYLIIFVFKQVNGASYVDMIRYIPPSKGFKTSLKPLPSLDEIESNLQSENLTITSGLNIQVGGSEYTIIDQIIDNLIGTYSSNIERLKISRGSTYYDKNMIKEIKFQNSEILKLIHSINGRYPVLYKNSLKKVNFELNTRCSKNSKFCKADDSKTLDDLESEGLAKCDPLNEIFRKFGVDSRAIKLKDKCPSRNYEQSQNKDEIDNLITEDIAKNIAPKCDRKLLGKLKSNIESASANYNSFVIHDDNSLSEKSECQVLRMQYMFDEKSKKAVLLDAYYLNDKGDVTTITQKQFDQFLKDAKIKIGNSTSNPSHNTAPIVVPKQRLK